ncbi:hypothetical protein GCM10027614_85060 [Micromonospora vulcania]
MGREDNFDSATNKEGDTNVAFSDVTVTGTVNTAVAGAYPVTYTYNGVSKKINVTVKAKQQQSTRMIPRFILATHGMPKTTLIVRLIKMVILSFLLM